MLAPSIDWNQFIGTASGLVYPSDFINFSCRNYSYAYTRSKAYFGRITQIGIDKRTTYFSERDVLDGKAIVIRVQLFILYEQLLQEYKTILGTDHLYNEAFIYTNLDFNILESNVEPFARTISIYYAFQSRVEVPRELADNTTLVVRRIVSKKAGYTTIRLVLQSYPIRRELEIIHFGRYYLLALFDREKYQVILLALLNFLDAFGLYRNIYRTLIGIYFLPIGLSTVERNRSTNVIPLTLGLHRSNVKAVVKAIGLAIRVLDKGIVLFDSVLATKLNNTTGKKKPIMFYISIFVYLGD